MGTQLSVFLDPSELSLLAFSCFLLPSFLVFFFLDLSQVFLDLSELSLLAFSWISACLSELSLLASFLVFFFLDLFVMDRFDLRLAATDDDNRFFSRKHQKREVAVVEVGGRVNTTEADKACSAAPEDVQRGFHKFNRLFRVNADRVVLSGRQPVEESPSFKVWHRPTVCSIASKSTFRMRSIFKHDDDGSRSSYFATGFNLSPSFSVTAGHCLLLEGANVDSIKGCHGNFVPGDMLEDLGGFCFDLHQHDLSPPCDWPEAQDGSGIDSCTEGLFRNGADLSLIVAGNGKGDLRNLQFLLPCSPVFSHLQDKNLFILSYPGIDKFLQDAEDDLINKPDMKSATWNAYEPAMREEIGESLKNFAAKTGKSEREISLCPSSMKKILAEVKQALWDHLWDTFGKFSNGSLLCSVGTSIVKDGNSVCFGSTASTLPGSSGGAICPQGMPGYFIGIHTGGSRGWDQNIGTSTDNPIFVGLYMSHVLGSLPPPDSNDWKDFNLEPFLQWLYQHREVVEEACPWLDVAKKFHS